MHLSADGCTGRNQLSTDVTQKKVAWTKAETCSREAVRWPMATPAEVCSVLPQVKNMSSPMAADPVYSGSSRETDGMMVHNVTGDRAMAIIVPMGHSSNEAKVDRKAGHLKSSKEALARSHDSGADSQVTTKCQSAFQGKENMQPEYEEICLKSSSVPGEG